MSVNLAALQEAAESLGRAAQKADEGRPGDARFALVRAGLAARVAFSEGSVPVGAFDTLIATVDGEVTARGCGGDRGRLAL